MWTCPKCERIFKKENQPHSCKKVSLNKHFENKDEAREIFNYLVEKVNYIGKCKIISIPCCVHLFGKYDFLAAFPKKEFLVKAGVSEKLVDEYYERYCDYDFQLFKDLWDEAGYPEDFPTECKNLTELLIEIPKEKLPLNKKAHDPLSDALWDLEVWRVAQNKLK
ncbi:hypothetical protein ACFL15_00140 [Patescibacteria group bacterium]